MLPWRGILNLSRHVRQSLPCPKRLIRTSPPCLQATLPVTPPRPNTLLAKIRFKPDGKPRSKLVGFAFGTLLLFNFLTLLTTYDLVDESELALGLLASLIYIQQADFSYDSVDLSSPASTLTYFKKLYQSFSRIPADEVEDIFTDLTRLMKQEGSEAEAEAHRIMRTAAEKIHEAFQDLDQESIPNTANLVFVILREALNGLIDLVEGADDDGDTKYTFQLIKDHSKKDAGVLKEYEILG